MRRSGSHFFLMAFLLEVSIPMIPSSFQVDNDLRGLHLPWLYSTVNRSSCSSKMLMFNRLHAFLRSIISAERKRGTNLEQSFRIPKAFRRSLMVPTLQLNSVDNSLTVIRRSLWTSSIRSSSIEISIGLPSLASSTTETVPPLNSLAQYLTIVWEWAISP